MMKTEEEQEVIMKIAATNVGGFIQWRSNFSVESRVVEYWSNNTTVSGKCYQGMELRIPLAL